ncbi:hypothetical protein C463_09414 [Halorubrum californiense DSM 19288]|uniref:Uncharacterized protein n=1 Tax=Halorubrum californiense DSM 19288 TaxID=1227465 RepID=M0E9Y9_9EURY|nr:MULTISPECIES: DUF5995 family protein [Halorubrum]ELZ43873.1 hypothetical protein C463_09414 [Halorubrum californiense DSM 19288]TKX71233.1 hypothetical protein EXE40_07780 [Halorubrum sp. GN11GM_10-3_MGM]
MIPIRTAAPTLTEAKALLAGLRRTADVDADAVVAELAGEEPDAGLLDLASEPFASVDDVAERLARTESYLRERGDRRAVFLTVYSRMTAAVRTAIDDGAFVDPEWAASYLVAFAERYRRALVAFERWAFDSLPRPWLIAFAAAARGETLVAQDALLGINAHITYDLTYTLGDIGIDPDRDAKREDHDRINAILARLVQTAQDALVEAYAAVGIAGIDRLLDPLDDRLALLGLRGVREFAWRNAVLRADLPDWVGEPYVDWRTETVATGAAAVVVAPEFDAAESARLRDAEADADAVTAFGEAVRRRM